MASITIRNIDDDLKERLRVRAAKNGHSMEEEARIILNRAIHGIQGPELLELTEKLFGKENGLDDDLDLSDRSENRSPPSF